MSEKEKHHLHQNEKCPGTAGDDQPDTDADVDALTAVREKQAAAEQAIEKILSGNSAAYVAQSVQHGGE